MRHVVRKYEIAMKVYKNRASFDGFPLPSWTNM